MCDTDGKWEDRGVGCGWNSMKRISSGVCCFVDSGIFS